MNTLYRILLFSLLMPLLAHGQAVDQERPAGPSDVLLWTGATFRFELTKDFRLEMEQQYRFEDTASSLYKSFTELGARYEVTDYFDIKTQYRYSSRERQRNEHRLTLDLKLKWDIEDVIDNFPVELEYRFRFTDETVQYTGEKTNYWRNRLGIDWNMSKLVDPFLEYENFYRLNKKNEWRANRITFGLEWKLSGDADLETYYRWEDSFNVSMPQSRHIFGLMLSYDIELH